MRSLSSRMMPRLWFVCVCTEEACQQRKDKRLAR